MAASRARFGRTGTGRNAPTVITSAHSGSSQELRTREKRYAVTMGFRTLCFLSMIFVPGPFRWVLFGCAVFLPYVAVVLANQREQRGLSTAVVPGEPGDARQLTTGPSPEVIPGAVAGSGDAEPEERVA